MIIELNFPDVGKIEIDTDKVAGISAGKLPVLLSGHKQKWMATVRHNDGSTGKFVTTNEPGLMKLMALIQQELLDRKAHS